MEYFNETEKKAGGTKMLSPALHQKYDALKHYFEKYARKGICIAYSGGVDSTLLLKIAADAVFAAHSSSDFPPPAAAKSSCHHIPAAPLSPMQHVLAVILETKLHPHSDTALAVMRTKKLHAVPEVIQIDEFQNQEIMNNPVNRCYLCKHLLFSELRKIAHKKGCTVICDGTNKDDEKEYRPGMKVLKELGIRSPLLELGITKSEVRAISAALGLSTASIPSTPCLATRLPYNTYLDHDLLQQIHLGEEWLRGLGFYNVRLRFHAPLLRIETDCSDFEALLLNRERIIEKMKDLGFLYITLDLEGFRSGSMDILPEAAEKTSAAASPSVTR